MWIRDNVRIFEECQIDINQISFRALSLLAKCHELSSTNLVPGFFFPQYRGWVSSVRRKSSRNHLTVLILTFPDWILNSSFPMELKYFSAPSPRSHCLRISQPTPVISRHIPDCYKTIKEQRLLKASYDSTRLFSNSLQPLFQSKSGREIFALRISFNHFKVELTTMEKNCSLTCFERKTEWGTWKLFPCKAIVWSKLVFRPFTEVI